MRVAEMVCSSRNKKYCRQPAKRELPGLLVFHLSVLVKECRDVIEHRREPTERPRKGEDDRNMSSFGIRNIVHFAAGFANSRCQLRRVVGIDGLVAQTLHKQHRRLAAIDEMD